MGRLEARLTAPQPDFIPPALRAGCSEWAAEAAPLKETT
jgi:hypothetical protein